MGKLYLLSVQFIGGRSLATHDGQEKAKTEVRQYTQEMNNKFLGFIQGIIAQYKSGGLVKSPAYYVNEAWKLLWISRDHGDIFQGEVADTLRTRGFFAQYIEGTKMVEGIKNPALDRIHFIDESHHLETLLSKAINYADKAIALDPEFIGVWAAYNVRAVLEIAQKVPAIIELEQKEAANNVIVTYIMYMQKATGALQTFNIAPLEAQLFYLFQHGSKPSDHLVKQLVFTIAAYKRIVTTFEENINVAIEAGNDQKGKFDIERPVSVEVATLGIDVNEALNHYLSTTKGMTGKEVWLTDNTVPRGDSVGANLTVSHRQMVVNQIEQYGGYLFKMRVVRLKEKEKSLLENIVVAMAGYFQIVLGIAFMAIPGVNVFLTSFAVSLVAQGVKDIISSAISLFTGNPINLKDWISAKGFSLAISLAISGALSLLQKIKEIYNLKILDLSKKMGELKDLAKNHMGEWVFDTFKMSVATRIITGVTAKLGNKLLVDEKDIETEANHAMDGILQSCKSVLERLKATNMLNALYKELESVILGYKWRFSVAVDAGLDVGTGVLDQYTDGVGQYINSVTHLVSNSIESSGIIEEISSKVKGIILNKELSTLKTGEIFRRVLVNSYRDIGELLAYELNAEKLDINDKYECADLNNVKLSKNLSKYKDEGAIDAVGKCKEVKDLLLSPDNFKDLRDVVVSGITRLKSNIQRNSVDIGANAVAAELARPAVFLANKAVAGIIDYIKENQAHPSRTVDPTPDRKMSFDPQLLKPKTQLPEKEKQPKLQVKTKTESKTITKSLETKCDELGICKFSSAKPDGFDNLITDFKRTIGDLNPSPNVCPRYAIFDDPTFFNQLRAGQLSEVTRKPKIEFVVRSVFPFFDKKHGFSIFTKTEGQKTIITGHPEEHNPFKNLQIVDVPYIEAYKNVLGDDWAKNEDGDYQPGDYEHSKKYRVIMRKEFNSDQELEGYLSKARDAVKEMESGNKGGRFDYDLCITDKCSGENSNTVQRVIYDAMGIKIEVPEDISLPGIEGKFYDGPTDNLPHKFGQKLKELGEKLQKNVQS